MNQTKVRNFATRARKHMLDAVRARGTLRLSLGLGITEEDIDYVLKKLPPLANQLIEMSPVD